MSEYLDQLTDAQRQAVEHGEGPLLVLAGPGSGKTRVVTCRIARLLERGVPGHQILALTFTNKAAEEMRLRVRTLAPYAQVWISTFHRFCSHLLRRMAPLVGLQENFTIYDAGDSLTLLKNVIAESDRVLTHHTPAQIAHAISNAKNRLLTPEQLEETSRTLLEEKAAQFYHPYQQRLREANAVDFDDLLMHVARLLITNPEVRQDLDSHYRFVMVDEYQDTNYAQYCIARGLSVDHPNLAVTGDPDQAIYAWRGADIQNILSFERDYPHAKLVRLEQNYRSTPEILSVANQLISNNEMRKEKNLYTTRESGDRVRLVRYEDERDEAAQIARDIYQAIEIEHRQPRDFAILYRINALSRTLEHAMRDQGLPYQIVNGVEFYQRKEVKDILAYLHLVNNPRDRMSFLRIINMPPRGLGKKSLDAISVFADRHGISLLEAARQATSVPQLSKRAIGAFQEFIEVYDGIAAAGTNSVEELVGLATSLSGYADHLRSSDTEEDRNRLANIEELATAARQYDESQADEGSLEGFLEQASLVNDVDAWESDDNKVTLMTLHAAKGLEFPVVYIIAIESEILPHSRSAESVLSLEEERRLFFVGITRAQDRLQLSFAERRNFRGRSGYAVPSSFLMELPREECETVMSNAYAMHRRSFRAERDVDLDAIHDEAPDCVSQVVDVDDDPAVDIADFDETTAVANKENEPVDPDIFELGMLVTHGQLGAGKVIALSGTGMRRRATIQFQHPPDRRTFVLAHTPLRPVRRPS